MRKISDTDLSSAIETLEASIAGSRERLPEELFLFISRHTPVLCVDLLVRNAAGETLLTWRDDEHFGRGWHLPGGVVRFKESRADRIKAVARTELGAEVTFDEVPAAIQEYIHRGKRDRSHHVSFLMRCTLASPPEAALRCRSIAAPGRGEWMWHRTAPRDLIEVHQPYADFLNDAVSVSDTVCIHLPLIN